MERLAVSMRLGQIVAALGVVLLAACGSPDPDGTDQPGAEDATPTPEMEADEPVLTAIAKLAPLADLVRQVGGERVEVVSFVPEGADSHTFQPRPGDVRRLAQADVFFANGLDLNDAVIRLAEANLPDGVPLVRIAEEIADPDEIVYDHVHGDGDDDHGHTHGDDDDHGHTHGDTDEPDGAGPNPHLWMSVDFAIRYVAVISDTLADVDPEGADFYRDRAEAYTRELEEVDARIAEAVATIPEENRRLVTYHDSWSYFGPRYGLEIVAAIQPADFSEPSAAEIRRIIDQIRELDIPAVFGSEVFPSGVLEVIADETGAQYIADLSDDDLPGTAGDSEHSYIGLMVRNSRLIVEALGGDPSTLDHVDPARR
jgi:ABC-type Zn uptake system ZnuABC Zn-binding protein ZnuA